MAEKKTETGTQWKESEKGDGTNAHPTRDAGAAGSATAKGRPNDDRAKTEQAAAAPKGETGGGEDGS